MELWKILKGPVLVNLDEKEFILTTDECITIPASSIHRLEALDDDAMVLEISLGHFDERDIVRLEDDYSRVASCNGDSLLPIRSTGNYSYSAIKL